MEIATQKISQPRRTNCKDLDEMTRTRRPTRQRRRQPNRQPTGGTRAKTKHKRQQDKTYSATKTNDQKSNVRTAASVPAVRVQVFLLHRRTPGETTTQRPISKPPAKSGRKRGSLTSTALTSGISKGRQADVRSGELQRYQITRSKWDGETRVDQC